MKRLHIRWVEEGSSSDAGIFWLLEAQLVNFASRIPRPSISGGLVIHPGGGYPLAVEPGEVVDDLA